MAPFVLVHPAWFGGWCWKKVTPILRGRGHEVFTPTLTGLGERAHLASREVGLETHVKDVASVLEFEDLHQVILVGNSSGGMIITGVADRMPERIAPSADHPWKPWWHRKGMAGCCHASRHRHGKNSHPRLGALATSLTCAGSCLVFGQRRLVTSRSPYTERTQRPRGYGAPTFAVGSGLTRCSTVTQRSPRTILDGSIATWRLLICRLSPIHSN